MMKTLSFFSAFVLFFGMSLVVKSCSSNDNTPDKPATEEPEGSCWVQLFDGDQFKDDNIVVNGPGEYKDLSNLSNSEGRDWTDEADSFKVGEGTTLTVWPETDFKGDSTVYDAGEYPSADEPVSMKIECKN